MRRYWNRGTNTISTLPSHPVAVVAKESSYKVESYANVEVRVIRDGWHNSHKRQNAAAELALFH